MIHGLVFLLENFDGEDVHECFKIQVLPVLGGCKVLYCSVLYVNILHVSGGILLEICAWLRANICLLHNLKITNEANLIQFQFASLPLPQSRHTLPNRVFCRVQKCQVQRFSFVSLSLHIKTCVFLLIY